MKRKRGHPKGSKNKPKTVLLPRQTDQVGCPIQDGPNWNQVSGERTGKQIDNRAIGEADRQNQTEPDLIGRQADRRSQT